MTGNGRPHAPITPVVPLCVDLDGTLIHADLFYDNLVAAVAAKPWILFLLPVWLAKGRAYLKTRLASHVVFDPAQLPYDERVLEYLRDEKAKGRRLILATASPQSQADAIAAYLSLFDAVFATEPDRNLKGSVKAALLSDRLGRFSYLGNAYSDVTVWKAAVTAGIANAPRRLARRIAASHTVEIAIPRQRGVVHVFGKMLRPFVKQAVRLRAALCRRQDL